MTMRVNPDADDRDVENAIGKRFVEIGNERCVNHALEELNRVDLSDLDDDAVHAYGEALQSITYLRESLKEPEERQPNAQVYGVTDDD